MYINTYFIFLCNLIFYIFIILINKIWKIKDPRELRLSPYQVELLVSRPILLKYWSWLTCDNKSIKVGFKSAGLTSILISLKANMSNVEQIMNIFIKIYLPSISNYQIIVTDETIQIQYLISTFNYWLMKYKNLTWKFWIEYRMPIPRKNT